MSWFAGWACELARRSISVDVSPCMKAGPAEVLLAYPVFWGRVHGVRGHI